MKRLLFFITLAFSSCAEDDAVRVYTVAKEKSALSWLCPENWIETKPGPMRTACFGLQGVLQEDFEVSITFLPGNSGSVSSNVNRWRKQIGLEALDETQIKSYIKSYQTELAEATVVNLSGAKQQMIVALIERAQGTWFVKALGKKDLVSKQEATFFQLLDSIK